jgi:hypothetical protein
MVVVNLSSSLRRLFCLPSVAVTCPWWGQVFNKSLKGKARKGGMREETGNPSSQIFQKSGIAKKIEVEYL